MCLITALLAHRSYPNSSPQSSMEIGTLPNNSLAKLTPELVPVPAHGSLRCFVPGGSGARTWRTDSPAPGDIQGRKDMPAPEDRAAPGRPAPEGTPVTPRGIRPSPFLARPCHPPSAPPRSTTDHTRGWRRAASRSGRARCSQPPAAGSRCPPPRRPRRRCRASSTAAAARRAVTQSSHPPTARRLTPSTRAGDRRRSSAR
mmetsp:Transcript_23453/g.75635  ORF Transcript_23453/g.75635 Transcript_23453/m.75635 type:complete len:201 (+) Transcript_23453:144-746(+)